MEKNRMLFIFDMGGVVTNTSTFEQISDKLKISQDDFLNICRKDNFDIKHALDIGKISIIEFWSIFNERIKNTDIPQVTNDLFRLSFHPELNLETVKIIKKLRKKHRVVCGTNTIEPHWQNHLERGDYSFFDQTYASNKIGAAKPDSDFFELIMYAEKSTPENTFFTDDIEKNIEGARKLGINAVQFTTAKDLYKNWKKYF